MTHSWKQKTQRYAFSILAMQDHGKIVYQFKKRWFFAGLICLGLMLVMPQLDIMLNTNFSNYMIYLYLGLFFVALLFFLLLVNTFSRHYVFYSVHAKLPLLVFWINKPSKKEFQNFISTLEDKIRQHKSDMKIPYSKQLAGEIRTIRRVAEAGLLSQSVYQAAKAKLLIMSDVNYRPSPSQE